MTHDSACTAVGVALGCSFAAGVLLSGHVVRLGVRAGNAAADYLAERVGVAL